VAQDDGRTGGQAHPPGRTKVRLGQLVLKGILAWYRSSVDRLLAAHREFPILHIVLIQADWKEPTSGLEPLI
jgi:hypothetical protein